MGLGVRFHFFVMGYLVEASAWRGIGVVVIFAVRVGVVFCLSVDFVCFMVHMHD